MSRVDLDKNRTELLNAFKEVTSTKIKTDWVLYGYDGQTAVLKVVSKGDDGIEGLVDELNSGRIMYAYIQVKDPNTDLPKLVCINWQGEGVQEQKKGKCANHISDVSSMFKGAHVTINARSDDDVDEDDIIKKVSKSSGANYSIHKEKPQPNANKPTGPIGSVYQKTRPHQEIKSNVREQFWKNEQDDEKKRQDIIRQKSVEEKTKLDQDTRERELKEAQNRDQRERERLQKIVELRQAEKRANAKDSEAEKKNWEQSQMESRRDEEERSQRADHLRKDRASEAKSLLSNREQNPRSLFEQKPASQFDEPARGPPPQRKLKHDFLEERQEDASRKQPIQLPRDEPSSPPAAPPSAPRAAPPSSPRAAPPSSPRAAPPSSPRAAPPSSPLAPPPAAPAGQPHTRNLLAEGLPPRRDSDEEAEQQDWDEPTTEDFSMPKTQPPAEEPQDLYDDVSVSQPPPSRGNPHPQEPEDTYDDVSVSQPPPSRGNPHSHEPENAYLGAQDPEDTYAEVGPGPDAGPPDELYDDVAGLAAAGNQEFPPEMGLVARALYDYQAMEENEVTFDPNDLITNIDQVDAGWWIGTTPDGATGMFPSNYVELING